MIFCKDLWNIMYKCNFKMNVEWKYYIMVFYVYVLCNLYVCDVIIKNNDVIMFMVYLIWKLIVFFNGFIYWKLLLLG